MSNVILNSNQNSALVSTIRESDSAIKQFAIYSEDQIAPPHALQILQIEPVNTLDDYKSRTISWDLPKQGYLCRLTLEFMYNYTATSAANDHMTPLGLLNCIDSIELLSSGRRIQEFSREVILAKMSDNPSHIGKAYEEGIGMVTLPSGTAGAAHIRCLLPLDMTFSSSLRHSINCDFVEPLRLRVRFTDGDIGRTFAANHYNTVFTGVSISEAKLICEYRQLAASDADAVVQANFGSGQMTSLVSTFAKAVPVVSPIVLGNGSADESPIHVELTENAAVENLYVMVHVPRADAIASIGDAPHADKDKTMHECDRPFPLERIVLEASGQVLIDVPARYIQHFGKRQDGVQRYAGTSLQDDVAAYVYKIELGFDNRFCSNVVSFRELSNPRLTVYPAKPVGHDKHNRRSELLNGYKPTVNVVYENKQLQTVSSANGRINLSISN
jgi:hypothetical protein